MVRDQHGGEKEGLSCNASEKPAEKFGAVRTDTYQYHGTPRPERNLRDVSGDQVTPGNSVTENYAPPMGNLRRSGNIHNELAPDANPCEFVQQPTRDIAAAAAAAAAHTVE
eukprot:5880090-Prymnesium_polylepis.1